MGPFDVIKLIVKIGIFLSLLILLVVRYRNKNKGIVDDAIDIELAKTPRGRLILRHRKFCGKIQLMLENDVLEEFNLPKFLIKRKFKIYPNAVNGINEIVITRPLFLAALNKGWRYQVLGDKKNVDIIV